MQGSNSAFDFFFLSRVVRCFYLKEKNGILSVRWKNMTPDNLAKNLAKCGSSGDEPELGH
jgi:hypothetical protein